MSRQVLRAPFPWFGGKSLAAPLIWHAFGNVPNYVEPFAGSLATLLARPHAAKVETANDKDGLIANFWRATRDKPDEVAHHADWPVNEADLHARHRWLVAAAPALLERLVDDPEYSDPKIAGWWVWGISAWIGHGWCAPNSRPHRQLPQIGTQSRGVHATLHRKKPGDVGRGVHGIRARGAGDMFRALSERLRNVRVCCGNWSRVLGNSTLGIGRGPGHSHGMSPCAVLLDPPYDDALRDKRLYREDAAGIAADVRTWALEHGDNPALRIALCGLDGEHDMPSWTSAVWSRSGRGVAKAERIWFSPHCLPAVRDQAELALGTEVR